MNFIHCSVENVIIKQFDPENKNVYLISAGNCLVSKYIDGTKNTILGRIEEGKMVGEKFIIFDKVPDITVTCNSYCSFAQIKNVDFMEMLALYPDIENQLTRKIIDNPYDIDRNYFICKVTKIPYLQQLNEVQLKKLYYKSSEHFYSNEELIFKLNQPSDQIYIVYRGVVSIEISDGYNSHILDIMGQGSIINQHNVLFNEKFCYQARAVSDETVKIMQVSRKVLADFEGDLKFRNQLEKIKMELELSGLPQIDYQICNENLYKYNVDNYIKQVEWHEGTESESFNFIKQIYEEKRKKKNYIQYIRKTTRRLIKILKFAKILQVEFNPMYIELSNFSQQIQQKAQVRHKDTKSIEELNNLINFNQYFDPENIEQLQEMVNDQKQKQIFLTEEISKIEYHIKNIKISDLIRSPIYSKLNQLIKIIYY